MTSAHRPTLPALRIPFRIRFCAASSIFMAAYVFAFAFAAAAQTPPSPSKPDSIPATPKEESKDAPQPAKKEETQKPATPPTKPQSIDTIDVTGKRNSTTDRRDSSAAKIIFTREDIEQYGDSNLGDVLRRLPSVTQGGRPGRGGPIQMRGMGGGFTQILINGERIAPGFSVEQITPEQVERIEILRAPTAETGTRAIAGTINIILREALVAKNNEFRGGVQVERSATTPNLAWTYNDKIGESGSYNITLSTTHTAQITDTNTQTTYQNINSGATEYLQQGFSQTNDKRDSLFLTSRLQWRLGPGEQFSLQPFIVSNRYYNRFSGNITQLVGVEPYATSEGRVDGQLNVARFMTMLQKRINQDTRFELRAGGGQFTTDSYLVSTQRNREGADVLAQTVRTDNKDLSGNIVGKLSRNWGEGHVFVTGAEFELTKRVDNAVTRYNGQRQLAEFGDEVNVKTTRRAFYLQDEWDPGPQFSTYFGARWEGIETKSDTPANPVSNKSSVLNPLAFGVWRFAAPKRDQIRLSLTQSYRAPTTQNLVARPSLNTLFPAPGANTSASPDRAGNPTLKPEIANGIDLAYENYLKAGGVVSVNFFTRQIKDLIRNVTALETVSWATTPRYVSRPQNFAKARTSGIEFDAKFALPELIEGATPINVRANLSVFDSNVAGIPGPNNRISEQPKATGNLGADYRFRGTPFSIGGTLAFTPAYETQLTVDQFQKVSTKRVFDAYGLWNVTPTTRVRLTFSNIAPRDLTTESSILQGSQQQTILSDGRTDMSVALRFEARL
jgi:outer membrane receptor for ferrienterochelin and colicins